MDSTSLLKRIITHEIAKNQGLKKITFTDWEFLCNHMSAQSLQGNLEAFCTTCNFMIKSRDEEGLTISLKLDFRFCDEYIKPVGCQESECPKFHCCAHHLSGNCRFGCKCKFSHDVKNSHNIVILKNNFLDHLAPEEIGCLLKIHFDNQKPLLCYAYNSLSGCKFGSQCFSLHLCNHFVKSNCRFGDKCKRSHDLNDPDVKKILSKRNFNPNQESSLILSEMRNFLGVNVSTTSADKEVKEEKGTEEDQLKQDLKVVTNSSGEPFICTFNLRGCCLYKESCQRFHQQEQLPYQWQYETNGSWGDITENKNVEKAYCFCNDTVSISHPKYKSLQMNIDLNNMTWCAHNYYLYWFVYKKSELSGRLRRLTTESFSDSTSEYLHLTLWKWYWRNDNNIWIEFEEEEGYPSSQKIENSFQDDPAKKFEYTAGGWKYELCFEKLTQTNMMTHKKRIICRRPDAYNENTKKPESLSRLDGNESASLQVTFPEYWQKQFKSDSLFQIVEVPRTGPTANEFFKVEKLFKKTMTQAIKSLKRIENKELWTFFTVRQQALERKHPSSSATKLLFHGTKKVHVDAICQQGFDFRLSGTSTGTIWGKGSYFARDAKYSNSYSDCGKIFLAKVIVGDFIKGDPTYCRPPLRPQEKYEMFDSCVDNIADPSIFVIFENHQAYPDYLIEY